MPRTFFPADPYIANVTPLHPGGPPPPLSEDGLFETAMHLEWNDTEYESTFAWIPSIFKVSEDGLDVRIESYINGLGPRKNYETLYRLIERAFLIALPHLERSLTTPIKREVSSSGELARCMFY